VKVLVVGASGLVGSAVARSLAARGADVLALSRSGRTQTGTPLRGDVLQPLLGLGEREARKTLDGLTHVVSCFGSVDWETGPRVAIDVHRGGTANVLRFAAAAPALERVVHVSSVLVFGRARRRVANDDLAVGQRFRNWYEYGKFLAEDEARGCDDVPVRVVRLGGVLGSDAVFVRSARSGLPAAVPSLLRGYAIHLRDGGRFPVYVSDDATSGEVLARAALDADGPDVWTWFDARRPSLAEVLVGLCAAWRVMPRIVSLPAARTIAAVLAPRLGVPRPLLGYTEPWVDFDPAVLAGLPDDLPHCPEGYVEAAGEALLRHASQLGAVA
jgi:nucleoside-diphosphate-sugar epimerase